MDAVQKINVSRGIANGDANIGISTVAKGATMFQTRVPAVTFNASYNPSLSGIQKPVNIGPNGRLSTVDPSYRVL